MEKKKTRYHAGLKYTGEQNGEWHEESLLYLKKDGTEKFRVASWT